MKTLPGDDRASVFVGSADGYVTRLKMETRGTIQPLVEQARSNIAGVPYALGHGTWGLAVGDVDPSPGDEVVAASYNRIALFKADNLTLMREVTLPHWAARAANPRMAREFGVQPSFGMDVSVAMTERPWKPRATKRAGPLRTMPRQTRHGSVRAGRASSKLVGAKRRRQPSLWLRPRPRCEYDNPRKVQLGDLLDEDVYQEIVFRTLGGHLVLGVMDRYLNIRCEHDEGGVIDMVVGLPTLSPGTWLERSIDILSARGHIVRLEIDTSHQQVATWAEVQPDLGRLAARRRAAQRWPATASELGGRHADAASRPGLHRHRGWLRALPRPAERRHVRAWGDNSAGQRNVPPLPPGLSYVRMTAGAFCSVAQRSDGSVVAWGDNRQYQCEVPALPPGTTMVQAAAAMNGAFTIARFAPGGFFRLGDGCAGSRGFAQLAASPLPQVGETFAVELSPPPVAGAVLLFGLSNTTVGAGPAADRPELAGDDGVSGA